MNFTFEPARTRRLIMLLLVSAMGASEHLYFHLTVSLKREKGHYVPASGAKGGSVTQRRHGSKAPLYQRPSTNITATKPIAIHIAASRQSGPPIRASLLGS